MSASQQGSALAPVAVAESAILAGLPGDKPAERRRRLCDQGEEGQDSKDLAVLCRMKSVAQERLENQRADSGNARPERCNDVVPDELPSLGRRFPAPGRLGLGRRGKPRGTIGWL